MLTSIRRPIGGDFKVQRARGVDRLIAPACWGDADSP
jgi:hypothetical protein